MTNATDKAGELVSPAAELTDEEIVDELAKHGVGMLGHASDVEPFPLDGDDAPIFIAACRALLARSPAQPQKAAQPAAMSDAEINDITMNKIGKWPSFEAQSWACKVVHAVIAASQSAAKDGK